MNAFLAEDIVVIDFETFYSNAYTLEKMPIAQYVRNSRFLVHGVGLKIGTGTAYWVPEDVEQELKKIDWANSIAVAHNAAFDGYILNEVYGIRPKKWVDTMAMARVYHNRCSLAALSKQFDLPDKQLKVLNSMKGKRLLSPAEIRDLGGYCIGDVENTYALLYKLIKLHHYPDKELWLIDLIIRMYTEPKLMIDKLLLKRYIVADGLEKERVMAQLNIAEEDLRSSDRVAELLRKAGVEPPLKLSPTNPDGPPIYAFAKTDEGFQALLEHDNMKVRILAHARMGAKSVLGPTRANRMLSVGSPFPVFYNYYGAHTGRLSGGDKLNAQNYERGSVLRKSITASSNHLLVGRDFSQIEARVVAYYAKQTDLMQSFASGIDVYAEFATVIYNVPVTEDSDPDKRFVGKTAILGLGYQCGAARFKAMLAAKNYRVDLSFAESIVKLYREKYPKIKRLWWRLNDLIPLIADHQELEILPDIWMRKGNIILPNGMPIRYPNLRYEDRNWIYDGRTGKAKLYGGKLLENITQGVCRIIETDAMLTISRVWSVVLTTHDDITLHVPENEAQQANRCLEIVMQQVPKYLSKISLDSTGGIGVRYNDVK